MGEGEGGGGGAKSYDGEIACPSVNTLRPQQFLTFSIKKNFPQVQARQKDRAIFFLRNMIFRQ
jgi:hypothetical protein